MGVFLAKRSLFVVAVKNAFQMVSSLTRFRETFFAIAGAGFPSCHRGTVIRVRAAMRHVIGFAFACKEMLRVLAFSCRRIRFGTSARLR